MIGEPFSLKGKVILITGASSGLGRQCALRCSEMGAQIILMGRDKDRLYETQSILEGDDHISIGVDLVDYRLVESSIKDVVKKAGQISGVINSAGISTTLPFASCKPDKLEHFLKTNVSGGLNLSRIVSKKSNFSVEGGSIIFISSVMGSAGEKGKSMYSITKGALDAGVRSLAVELASRKIRINSISPGVVVTPLSQKAVYSTDEESLRKVSSLHPLGLGQPDDVAYAATYLLSDAARWITGINMVVDGGYLAR